MRLLLAFLIGVVTAATVAAVDILVTHNPQLEPLYAPGIAVYLPQGLVVGGAASVGFLLAVLLLVPGRLASARRNHLLVRQVQAHDAQLRALGEDHAELRGRHQRLSEEHQRVLDHMLIPITTGNGQSPAPTSPASSQSAGTPASAPASTAAVGAGDGRRFTVKVP